MANAYHEAKSDDAYEIRIISPETKERKNVLVEMMDVNGDDNKVLVVKTSILLEEMVENPNDYYMVAINKREAERVMDDDASILDYFEEMSNGHFEFRLKE
ncbi:uncharacterized protein LOC131948935 [Physella acuta]|uniref:uncharacterized protein LOC131948935 n=1 Tax=Physella acuta TaxID=109671 RepID=UPI0027DD8501|nr:uncharacterized protein LOC131948935 [Physella acuta]